MESPCPQLPVYLEGRVPPGLRAVGKQSGEASRSSPVGDSEQVRQDSVLHQGQMGGAQRGPPFQDASLCLPREGQFYATAFRGPRSIRHWQATFFSASLFPLKKAPRPVPQHLLRVTIKIHLSSRGPAPPCV